MVASLIELFPKLLSEPQVVAYIEGAVNAEVGGEFTDQGDVSAFLPALLPTLNMCGNTPTRKDLKLLTQQVVFVFGLFR